MEATFGCTPQLVKSKTLAAALCFVFLLDDDPKPLYISRPYLALTCALLANLINQKISISLFGNNGCLLQLGAASSRTVL
jgi:hypothetical protein